MIESVDALGAVVIVAQNGPLPCGRRPDQPSSSSLGAAVVHAGEEHAALAGAHSQHRGPTPPQKKEQ